MFYFICTKWHRHSKDRHKVGELDWELLLQLQTECLVPFVLLVSMLKWVSSFSFNQLQKKFVALLKEIYNSMKNTKVGSKITKYLQSKDLLIHLEKSLVYNILFLIPLKWKLLVLWTTQMHITFRCKKYWRLPAEGLSDSEIQPPSHIPHR